MRVIEGKNGAFALWMPNIRSPRYAFIAVASLAPALIVTIEELFAHRTLIGAAIVIALVILAAFTPIATARASSLIVTRDLVLKGSPRKPSRKIQRTDVVFVRYRGEFGEFIGGNGAVLLQMSPLLTRQQVKEAADYLHVPFSGSTAATPVADVQDLPDVFFLRPDKGKAIRYLLLIGLLYAMGIGLGVLEFFSDQWGSGIYVTGVLLAVAVAAVVRYRAAALVVTVDAVYKGTRDRGKFAARAEISEIAYGPRIMMKAASGTTLLEIDATLFTPAQANELALRLDIPMRRVPKASKLRST